MRVTRSSGSLGQTGSEYMLLLSVITLGVVYAAYSFVAPAQLGIEKLGRDVAEILSGQSIGGVGRGGSTSSGASTPSSTATGPSTAPPAGSLRFRNPAFANEMGPVYQTEAQKEQSAFQKQLLNEPVVTTAGPRNGNS